VHCSASARVHQRLLTVRLNRFGSVTGNNPEDNQENYDRRLSAEVVFVWRNYSGRIFLSDLRNMTAIDATGLQALDRARELYPLINQQVALVAE
jgi:hypothetical protein